MTPVLDCVLAALGGLASSLHMAEHKPFNQPSHNLAISRGVRLRSAVIPAQAAVIPAPDRSPGQAPAGIQHLVVIPAQAGIQASSLFPRSRLKSSVRPLLLFLLLPQLGPYRLKRFESLLLGQHAPGTLTPAPSGRGRGEGPTRHPRPGCCEEHCVHRIGVAGPGCGQSPSSGLL